MPIPKKSAHDLHREKEASPVEPAALSPEKPEGEEALPDEEYSSSFSRRRERLRKPPEYFQTTEVPAEIAFLDPAKMPPFQTIPSRRNRWLMFGTGLFGAGLLLVLLVEVYTNFVLLYTDHPFIGLAFLLGCGLVGGGIIVWGGVAFWRFRRLRENSGAKELFQQVESAPAASALSEWLLAYFQERWTSGLITHEQYEKIKIWLRKPAFHQEKSAIAEAFQPLDDAAKAKVAEVALAAGVSTALSQRGWLDILLMLGKGIYLVSAIAEIYGTRPGTLVTVNLFWKSLRNGLFSGIFDTAGDNLAVLVTRASGDIPLIGTATSMATQGLANAILMCRLGLACMQECRPAPLDRSSLLSMYATIFKEKITFKKIYTLLKAKESPA